MLFVHAHPDDETIDNGATMARYAAEGAHVALVTCTLGEEGDVVVPELAHLGAAYDDRLAEHRAGELDAAMAALGVADHRILHGVDDRYRDSGMMGSASNEHPRCFWRADVDEAAQSLVATIRELRPQILVTYTPDGGYGHPDHIQAHRVAMRAAELAAQPDESPGAEPHAISKIYWNCHPRTAARFSAKALQAEEHTPFVLDESAISTTDDSFTTCTIDATCHLAAKTEAMRAHRTQMTVHAPFFALSNNVGRLITAEEHYHLAYRRPDLLEGARTESDLFAGL